MFFSKTKKINRLRDFTYYNGAYNGKIHDLANKPTNEFILPEISFLLRENRFTDVAIELGIKYLDNAELNINVFHYTNESNAQRELIRELILIDKYYWNLYPNLYSIILSKIESKLSIIRLPKYIKDQFIKFIPSKIEWKKEENEWYEDMINNNAAITVLSAYRRIRQLKRAILHKNQIEYKLSGREIIIDNEKHFNEILVGNLIANESLKEYLKHEKLVN